MMDERRLKAAQLRSQGLDVTEVAKECGISRTSFYNWMDEEEFKAELSRCEQEFLTTTRKMLAAYGPKAVTKLIALSNKATSEKVQMDATAKILDKLISNANKLEIDDARDSETVSADILSEELSELEAE